MNALIRGGVLFLFVCISVTFAAEATVRVATSRDLKLAVIDSTKASSARDALHAAFAQGLSEAISKQCGSTVGVRTKCVSADHAAFNLGTGVYDAVLVLTGNLPRALMTSDVTRLSATLGSGRAEKKVYMIFSNGDERLAQLLGSSFAPALTDGKFLDSVDGLAGRISEGGAKMASAQ